MRKSGLHKQISSIFDGVPVPQKNDGSTENPEKTDAPAAAVPTDAQEPTHSQPKPESIATSQSSGSSLVKRMSADPSECASAPAIPAQRPMPLPKTSIKPAKTGPTLSSQVKKMVFGSNKGTLDARQKKMAALVGILGVVFGAVLFISLGGVGQTKVKASKNNDEKQTAESQTTKKTAQDWVDPQPLPAELRDATMIVSRQTPLTEDGSESTTPGQFVVKGIVFSQNKPSAIINNEILTEGQSINGVTIVRITKGGVEFQAGDKNWTQQVQR